MLEYTPQTKLANHHSLVFAQYTDLKVICEFNSTGNVYITYFKNQKAFDTD